MLDSRQASRPVWPTPWAPGLVMWTRLMDDGSIKETRLYWAGRTVTGQVTSRRWSSKHVACQACTANVQWRILELIWIKPATFFSDKMTIWNTFWTHRLSIWHRGELSYLARLGSENISAPYFKQCFFRGGGYYPPQDWVKHHASQSQDRNKYFILYIEFCINNKI